jgi:hypothetical protein
MFIKQRRGSGLPSIAQIWKLPNLRGIGIIKDRLKTDNIRNYEMAIICIRLIFENISGKYDRSTSITKHVSKLNGIEIQSTTGLCDEENSMQFYIQVVTRQLYNYTIHFIDRDFFYLLVGAGRW